MHRRTRTWLALIGGLVMIAASLGTTVGAQAATRSVQSAAGIDQYHCYDFYPNEVDSSGYSPFAYIDTTDNILHFAVSKGDLFCPALVLGSSDTFVLFDETYFASNGEAPCLALDATHHDVYMQSVTVCNGTPSSDLEWKFTFVKTDPRWGNGMYLLQSQDAAAGYPCVADNGSGTATAGACNPSSPLDTLGFLAEDNPWS